MVLKRILGRQRNMVTLPDGTRHWPSFPSETWMDIAPIRQIQLVQRTLQQIDARIVASRALTPQEENSFILALQDSLGYPFNIVVDRVEAIPRAANSKYEDFISEVPLNPSSTP
ncbi:MAG: hypothetical protein Q8L40_03000, partial [Burkholderiales bacterium]|nr:hypothetical protein [Burkholderiales bacterium]